ncbi:putative Ig domain-containing protein [Petrachloros mirabilis]
MPSNIKTWLDCALQQMAAESYLDQFVLQGVALQQVLTDGNNDRREISLDKFTGKTQFTDLQAQQFTQRYQIVDHHANDASGFSATLMHDNTTSEYTLSFRSTEPRPGIEGGDVERDGLFASGLTPAADGEIGLSGFAFGQLMAMEQYFSDLRQGKLTNGTIDPTLQAFFANPANQINVTGYSLGGHLATIFTELHASHVVQTTVFNASGRGRIDGFSGTDAATLSAEAQQINAMLLRFMTVLFNPQAGVMQPSDEDLVAFQFAREVQLANPTWNPFTSGSAENLYVDPRYRWAKQVTLTEFDTVGTAELEIRTGLSGIQVTEGAFSKITQIFGDAAFGDDTLVALSGLSAGPIQSVLIEGQPLLPGTIIPRLSDAGSSHSITLIVDSLAVQELIQAVDPAYRQAGAELLIRAASNIRAIDTLTQERAEGDSLEKTVDAFRKLFLGPTPPPPYPLNVDFAVGGFSNLNFRNEMYAAIQTVKKRVAALQAQFVGMTFTIADLGDPTIAAAAIVGAADTDTDLGIAYRYALKELNPFAIIANSTQANDALYAVHNDLGQLDRFNSEDGAGTLTAQYFHDRALFLAEKISLNMADRQISSGNIHFVNYLADSELAAGQIGYEIETRVDFRTDQEFLFGSDGLDQLEGNSGADHLYGGGGADTLIGKGGNDYLQGDGGGDLLDGGDGSDTLLGGAGGDVLNGGEKADILIGGTGDDLLEGGTGFDTYIYSTGDGNDRIEDSDAAGMIKVNGQILIGGLKKTGHTDWTSPDGTISYAMSGTDLVVKLNGTPIMTVNENFQSGQFGIRLVDLPSFADATRTIFDKIDHYEQVGTNPDGSPILEPVYAPFFDDNANDTQLPITNISPIVPPIGDDNNLIYAGGGDDFVQTGAGDDQVYGEAGDDSINGMGGNDQLYGGLGNDILTGDDPATPATGNDYLDGGDGNDLLFGGIGGDILLGGDGNDHLEGDDRQALELGLYGDDYLDGGAGDDELHGGGGDDVLIGGAGNDLLIGDTTQYQNGTPEQGGNDVLDGGSGDDELDGVYGDDLLIGGSGKDLLNGEDGSDVLNGGADNDILSGDLRVMSLGGSQYAYDTSEYRAAGGDDLLFGGDGNDIMFGGEGNDSLEGDVGNDSLFGGYNTAILSSSNPLYWTLFTAPGSDWLDAGAGDDVLAGGVGTDTLDGGEGNDILYGGGGDDILEGGIGDDLLYGEYDFDSSEFQGNPFLSNIRALAGSNTLEGGPGNDTLYGGSKADTLIGGEGNDRLFGGSGLDVLIGGDGDDRIIDDDPNTPTVGENETLDGGAGNDYLESWWGDDILLGGMGNDTLVSRAGNDALFGDEGDDRLVWENTTSTSTQILFGGTGNDVYEIKTAGAVAMESAGEGIDLVITGGTYTLPDHIENLTSGWVGIGNTLDNVINAIVAAEGREGNDTLIGPGRLDGGVGDDLLQGGSVFYLPPSLPPPPLPGGLFGGGEPLPPPTPTIITNTYVFGVGYGHDTIQEMDPEFNSAYYQNEDTVQFLSGITPTDVIWERQGDDLELSVNGGMDRLTVQSFYDLSFNVGGYKVNDLWVPPQGFETTSFTGFPSYYAPSRVESFTFADGTVWTVDHFGAPLLGDFHADTYRFGFGSGDVTALDFDFTDPSSPDKPVDVLRLGAGVTGADVSVSVENAFDLVLSIAGTDDRFTIQSFLTSVVVFPPFSSFGYSTLPYQIEQLRFDDGTMWSVSDLYNRISTISGTANADLLNGNNRDNFIQGLDGDGFLDGGGGNDVLDGGRGADTLRGGTGYDTYVFNIGDGIDTIVDTAMPGEGNRILFGAGITQNDLTLLEDTTTGTLTIGVGANGTDQLILSNFDQTGANGSLVARTLVFADGSTVNLGELFPQNQAPTVAVPLVDQTVQEDAPFSIQVPANAFVDPDAGDSLTYSASLADGTALPLWLTFDVATQTFSGTPDDAQVGSLTLRVTATDSGNLSASEDFTLTVTNVDEAPTAAIPLADQTVLEDAPLTFLVPVNTFVDEDAIHGDTLTYSATSANGTALPGWLGFDANTRTFNGTPLNADVGSLDVTVTATDGGGLRAVDTFSVNVQNVNDAPTVAVPLGDQTGAEDEPFSFTVPAGTFADEDLIHGDELSYEAALVGGTALPAWLSFDETTQTFSGIPGAGDAGTLDIVVTAMDAENASVSDEFVLAVSGPLPKAFVGTDGDDVLIGARGDDALSGLAGKDLLEGGEGNDFLDGGTGADIMEGGTGDDTYVVDDFGDVVTELAGEGIDTVQSSLAFYALGSNIENLTMTGASTSAGVGNTLDNGLLGNEAANLLVGGDGNDVLQGRDGSDALDGGAGNDTLTGGKDNDVLIGAEGNDTFFFERGHGQDLVKDNSGAADKILYDRGIDPLDLVISRQANDLRLAVHGTTDAVIIDKWYSGVSNRTETIQAGNGQVLLSTNVDQLIQAMASFSKQTGLTWDQAIDQRPQEVQTILAASWQ